MSLLKFLLKPKRKLAKPKTKRVTLFGYVLSSHVQNRIADPKRGINKFSVITHFIAPPVVTGPETISKKGWHKRVSAIWLKTYIGDTIEKTKL